MRPFRVGVAGEALVDVVHRRGSTATTRPGGAPYNVAIGLARLGLYPTLATQIGADHDGDQLRRTLRRGKVLLHELEPAPQHTARAFAAVDSDGAARYEFDVRWDPEQLPAATSFDLIHIGSLGTMVTPGADVVISWAKAAATAGIPVSFDPNVRLGVADAAEYRRRFGQIAAFARIIKLSDDDAGVLFPNEQPEAIVRRLAAHTLVAAITLGDKGALMASGVETARLAAPRVEVIDTIGAGDAFTAALLSLLSHQNLLSRARLDSRHLSEILRGATVAAAIDCGRTGADPPTQAELDTALAATKPW
jgi:fructokinase